MEPELEKPKVETSVISLGHSPEPGNHMHAAPLEPRVMVWKTSVSGPRLRPKLESELFFLHFLGKLLDDITGFSGRA